MKKEFRIRGMHCQSCAVLIEKSLSKKEGISSANVNFATEKLNVDFDSGKLSEEKIMDLIKEKGYSAEEIDYENADVGSEKEISYLKKLFLSSLMLSLPVMFLSMLLMNILPFQEFVIFVLSTPVQFVVGYRFYKGAFGALKNRTANMDTLIVLGTSAAYFFSAYNLLFSPGSPLYFEASAMLLTLVILGRYFETKAKGRANEAIKKLINLSPKTATIIRNGKKVSVSVGSLKFGDVILVKPGQKVPVDGKITEGATSIDEAMITGESIPVDKKKGDSVIGGTINKHGTFKFKATKIGKNTILSRIIQLIEDAQGKKAPIQRFADRISSYFVPVVILIALVTFSVWYLFGLASLAVVTGVSVLVVACPCALGLATPTAIMVGIGKGAKSGILIKGGEALENTNSVRHVVFDKTGTLTKGIPEVTSVVPAGLTEGKVLEISACIESSSEHPLAEAIIRHAKEKKVKITSAKNFLAIPGKGVTGTIRGKKYFLGNSKFISEKTSNLKKFEGSISELEGRGNTVMLLSDGKRLLGMIAAADIIKEESKEAVSTLKNMGIRTYMITGDNKRTAKAIGNLVGINEVFQRFYPRSRQTM